MQPSRNVQGGAGQQQQSTSQCVPRWPRKPMLTCTVSAIAWPTGQGSHCPPVLSIGETTSQVLFWFWTLHYEEDFEVLEHVGKLVKSLEHKSEEEQLRELEVLEEKEAQETSSSSAIP